MLNRKIASLRQIAIDKAKAKDGDPGEMSGSLSLSRFSFRLCVLGFGTPGVLNGLADLVEDVASGNGFVGRASKGEGAYHLSQYMKDLPLPGGAQGSAIGLVPNSPIWC
jgi:hypothetical protein